MDIFKTVLLAGIAFNLVIVATVTWLVIRYHSQARQRAAIKQRQIVEQGKTIIAQERNLRGKDAVIAAKNELIEEFRKQ